MNIRKFFSLKNINAAVLYFVGLFGMHIALLIAVIIYIPSRTTTMPFRAAVLIVSLWAAFVAIKNNFNFYRGKLWITLAIFWSFYGLSILMEPIFVLQKSKLEYCLYAFGICAIPTIGYLIATTQSNIRLGMKWLFASAILAGFLSILLYGDASLHGVGRTKTGDFLGDFVALSPLLLSYMGSALVAISIWFIFVRESLSSLFLRFLTAGLCAAIGTYMMALGASRGPVFAVLLPVLVFYVARVQKARDVISLVAGLVGVALLAMLLFFFADQMGSALGMRLKSLIHIQETITFGGTGIGRIGIYQLAIEQFMGNPILGNGLYVRAVQAYPHNFIIEAYMTTGLIGGTAFLIYFCTCVWRAIKIIRYFPEHSWVSLLFLHYAVYVQLSSGIITNHYFWYSSAMVIAVYYFSTNQRHIAHRKLVRHLR